MSTGKRSGRGYKDRHVGETAGIRPYKLDLAFDNDTDFLSGKSDKGEAATTAEEADWYYNSVQNCLRFYDGSRWVNVGADKYAYENFRSFPLASLKTDAAGPTTGGAAAPDNEAQDVNILNTGKVIWEQHLMGGGQVLPIPTIGANGLDVSMDNVDNDGAEFTLGITSRAPCTFTVGTDPAFFVKLKVKVAEISGCDPLLVGFRKAEAYQTDYNAYDELVGIGFVGTDDIKTQTILNNAATSTKDTAVNGVDTEAWTFTVKVSSSGVVTYQVHNASGVAQTLATDAFTFDDGEVVIPYIFFLHGSDVAGTVELQEFECGYQLDDN